MTDNFDNIIKQVSPNTRKQKPRLQKTSNEPPPAKGEVSWKNVSELANFLQSWNGSPTHRNFVAMSRKNRGEDPKHTARNLLGAAYDWLAYGN